MKLIVILCALLVLACGGLLWQTYQLGKNSAHNEELSREVKNHTKVLDELRALTADAREVLAQLRANEQQRNAQGEVRRENIRDAIKNNSCANTVVPAFVSNSLQHRTAAPTDENRARISAGKSDSSNTNATTDHSRHMGSDSYLE
ncbi:DUF2570 domain-containing protein [Yersinia enterocolitica]